MLRKFAYQRSHADTDGLGCFRPIVMKAVQRGLNGLSWLDARLVEAEYRLLKADHSAAPCAPLFFIGIFATFVRDVGLAIGADSIWRGR